MRPNMMVGAMCVIASAALTACGPSQALDAPVKHTEPVSMQAPSVAKSPAPKSAPKRAAASATSPTVSNAVASKDATAAAAPAPELRMVTAKQDDSPVAATITGCLVLRDDGMFQLKDNDGEHAPKARSWKSGFIKKGSTNIDVFDAGNRLKLGSHVGYRVSVSGTLSDRALRARALRATSERCD